MQSVLADGQQLRGTLPALSGLCPFRTVPQAAKQISPRVFFRCPSAVAQFRTTGLPVSIQAMDVQPGMHTGLHQLQVRLPCWMTYWINVLRFADIRRPLSVRAVLACCMSQRPIPKCQPEESKSVSRAPASKQPTRPTTVLMPRPPWLCRIHT